MAQGYTNPNTNPNNNPNNNPNTNPNNNPNNNSNNLRRNSLPSYQQYMYDKMLLYYKSMPNTQHRDCVSNFFLACVKGNEDLLEKIVEPENKGGFLKSFNNNKQSVDNKKIKLDILLKHKDQYGNTGLDIAIINGNYEIARKLLEYAENNPININNVNNLGISTFDHILYNSIKNNVNRFAFFNLIDTNLICDYLSSYGTNNINKIIDIFPEYTPQYINNLYQNIWIDNIPRDGNKKIFDLVCAGGTSNQIEYCLSHESIDGFLRNKDKKVLTPLDIAFLHNNNIGVKQIVDYYFLARNEKPNPSILLNKYQLKDNDTIKLNKLYDSSKKFFDKVENGNLEYIKSYIATNIKPKYSDTLNSIRIKTALSIAVEKNHVEIAEYLVDTCGVNIYNKDGDMVFKCNNYWEEILGDAQEKRQTREEYTRGQDQVNQSDPSPRYRSLYPQTFNQNM